MKGKRSGGCVMPFLPQALTTAWPNVKVMQASPAQRKPDANVGDSDRGKLDLHGIRSRKEKNERS